MNRMNECLNIINAQHFRFKARLGDQNHNSIDDDTNLLILDIQETIVHPDYDHESAYFDVAILVTERIRFTRGIRPVCLPR